MIASVNEDSSENQLVKVKIRILGMRSAREPAYTAKRKMGRELSMKTIPSKNSE